MFRLIVIYEYVFLDLEDGLICFFYLVCFSEDRNGVYLFEIDLCDGNIFSSISIVIFMFKLVYELIYFIWLLYLLY